MTITLELTPQQEARLRKRAARQGKAPADVLTAFVETLPEEVSMQRKNVQPSAQTVYKNVKSQPVQPMTGAEIVAFWKRSDAASVYANSELYPLDSPETARQLREQEEARQS